LRESKIRHQAYIIRSHVFSDSPLLWRRAVDDGESLLDIFTGDWHQFLDIDWALVILVLLSRAYRLLDDRPASWYNARYAVDLSEDMIEMGWSPEAKPFKNLARLARKFLEIASNKLSNQDMIGMAEDDAEFRDWYSASKFLLVRVLSRLTDQLLATLRSPATFLMVSRRTPRPLLDVEDEPLKVIRDCYM
jgi:hypothetical protein